jgi:hypothetical protein
VHSVRILKLYGNRTVSVGEPNFLKHFRERVGFEYGKVPALLALPRGPAHERNVARAVGFLYICIGPGLIELMIEGRHDIFPGSVKHGNAVDLSTCQAL